MTSLLDSIKNPQDEAMRTKFICSIKNAVLKSIFKVNDNDLTFAKAVVGVEDASRVAKETMYGSTSDTVIHKITRQTGKLSQAKPTATSQSEKVVCLRCGKPNHTTKACKRKELFCKFCSKKGHLDVTCLKKSKQAIRTIIHSPVQSVSDVEPYFKH